MIRHALWISVLFATTISAQEFVGPKVDPASISVTKDIVYRTVGTETFTFDLYHPQGAAIVPVAITCNIGNRGMKEWPGYVGWGEATAAAGIASVQYSAIGEDATGQFDALMETLRARAGELRIDPTRIVLWAGSSNVQLGLPLAMSSGRDYIRGAVIYYGSAEIDAIRSDLPVYFVRAGLDQKSLNERIDSLAARALSANAPWTIDSFGGGVHGFDIFNDNDLSREIIARTLQFMTRVTTPELARAYKATGEEAALGAAFNREEWATAIDGFTELVAAKPNDPDAHLRLGLSLYGGARYAEALPELEKAWQLGRRGPRDTGVPAARAAAKSGNVDRTVHWLSTVLSTPHVSLADIRADDAFVSVLKEPALIALLAEIEEQNAIVALLESGKTSEGIDALTRSKTKRFAREDVLKGLGYRVLSRGHNESAIAVFELWTRRNRQSADAWESLSEALERVNRNEDALEYARRALGLAPEPSVRQAAEGRIARLTKK